MKLAPKDIAKPLKELNSFSQVFVDLEDYVDRNPRSTALEKLNEDSGPLQERLEALRELWAKMEQPRKGFRDLWAGLGGL